MDNNVFLEFKLPFPVDRVWNAVVINEVLIQWLADKVTGRPVLGEKFTWSWDVGDLGEYITSGIYKAVVPGKMIELEWKDHPAGDIILKMEFIDVSPTESILKLSNTGYPRGERNKFWADASRAGWIDIADKLQSFLKKWNGVVPPRKSSLRS